MAAHKGKATRFQIYALIDPRDARVRYIGMSKDADVRLHQHQISPCSLNMLHWTHELKQRDLLPQLKILETIEIGIDASVSATRFAVYERERYWIDTYLKSGANLLNTLGITRAYPHYAHGYWVSQETAQRSSPAAPKTRRPQSTHFPPLNTVMKLEELIERALMTHKEVAYAARLALATISRMINGHPTSRLSVRKVLAVLSQKLGREIDISEIDGLNITEQQGT